MNDILSGDRPTGASVVSDPGDPRCRALLRQAYALYGEPTERQDITDRQTDRETAFVDWLGIGTIMTFEFGPTIDGCDATYVEGGPASGVPAIVPSINDGSTPPDPGTRPPTPDSAIDAATASPSGYPATGTARLP